MMPDFTVTAPAVDRRHEAGDRQSGAFRPSMMLTATQVISGHLAADLVGDQLAAWELKRRAQREAVYFEQKSLGQESLLRG